MTKDKTPEPPGAVSDQNAEEAPSEQEDRDYGLRRPRPVDADHWPDDDGGSSHGGGEDGAASEGSQSTGHPESAG